MHNLALNTPGLTLGREDRIESAFFKLKLYIQRDWQFRTIYQSTYFIYSQNQKQKATEFLQQVLNF